MFSACSKEAYSSSQEQRKRVSTPGTQVAPARSRVRSVRTSGSFSRWRNNMAASVGPVQGGAGKDQTMTAQGQVVRGRTGAGSPSASGASDGVSRDRPQRARGWWRRTRGDSAQLRFISFDQIMGLLCAGSRFGTLSG
jgi:hypothetical protein